MLETDPLANVMHVDLTRKSYRVERRPGLFDEWIGGTGVATRLLLDTCPEGCDPLEANNPVILAVGPMTGLFPLASKTVAMFKSPLTGDLGESHCGGRSAVAIRNAGLGAIVITGKADLPVYLSISDGKARFRNATTLWGMDSTFTAGKIIRQAEPGAGLRTIMRIGKAGENLVRYACVTAETYRHFGRLGLGAVFGSKNLKAIVVSGKASFPVSDMKAYKALYARLHETAVTSSLMKKYHDIGTAINVNILNGLGALPTRNVQSGSFEGAGTISGEHLAEHYLGRRLACAGCPVACIHIAALREPYENEPYFYKTTMVSYDHEPIFAAGSMLGIGDPVHFLQLMDEIEKLGLDVMSAGVTMAWMTEAFNKGLVGTVETTGIEPAWGDVKSYIAMARTIVDQPNEFFQLASRGVEVLASRYGGKDFAMAFGKNEMPGYHTGPACYVGYSIGARHSHLDNAGYSVDQGVLMERHQAPGDVVENLVREEEWRQVLSSMTVCFFARNLYKPDVVVNALALSGFDVDEAMLATIGKRIHRAKYEFKIREGFVMDETTLPRRIYETPTPVSFMEPGYVEQALRRFKEIVGL